ncbi:hypothetical protein [Jeotgalibaca porci]
MKKLIKELKWLGLSALIVFSAIGLVIGTANFCQWRVEQNEIKLLGRGY